MPTENIYKEKFVRKIIWNGILTYTILHLAALCGLYRVFTTAKVLTTLFGLMVYVCAILGITAGVHRLWSHKSYKAKLPLRVILMVLNLLAYQNTIWNWCRDHRIHHKYADTDADPHNSKRGLFFSHIGWLMSNIHPDVEKKRKDIDMSDLEADSVVVFQKKYYFYLMPVIAFLIPTMIPMYFWNETFWDALLVSTVLRHTLVLNCTFLVNSFAHLYGDKPYDKNINPGNNTGITILTLGEGSHNYHHTFPWDYKASELGGYYLNLTTGFIDLFAKIGWAYDLKVANKTMIEARIKRTGDCNSPLI